MENSDFRPKPGEFYKNDQGKLFQIVTTAHVPDTDEKMLVYQELQDDFKIYVRPLSGFSFQSKELGKDTMGISSSQTEGEETAEEGAAHTLTMAFLDARTNKEKLEILVSSKGKLTERILDDIALSLDLQLNGQSLQEGYEYIKSHLDALIRFEGSRLR